MVVTLLYRGLDQLLAQRSPKVVATSHKKPIATVVPYVGDYVSEQSGLASLTGGWVDLDEIARDIDEVYQSRQTEPYREIPD